MATNSSRGRWLLSTRAPSAIRSTKSPIAAIAQAKRPNPGDRRMPVFHGRHAAAMGVVAALLMGACATIESGAPPVPTAPAQQVEPVKPEVVSANGVQPLPGSPSVPARAAAPQVVPGTGEFARPSAPDAGAAPTVP